MRLPALNSHVSATLSDAIADMRARISRTSQEAVTGRFSDLTAQLDGRIGDAMLGSKALDDLSGERAVLSLRETRLDLIQSTLSGVQSASAGLATRLETSLGLGDRATTDLAANDAAAALSQVFSALNVRHGERYLFAGDATSTAPLPDPEALLSDLRSIAMAAPDGASLNAAVATYFNDPAGPWHQTVYAGSATVSDPDAITATAPALTELISGLAVLALARPEEGLPLFQNDPAILQQTAAKLRAGDEGLLALRADRGVAQQTIARNLASLDIEETLLSKAFNGMTARDQYEAASHLRELETNLEAAYLITSRISNLTLLNFLR